MTLDPLKIVEFAERSRPRKELIVGMLQRLRFAIERSLKKWSLLGLALPFMLLASQAMAATYTVTNLK